MLAKGDGEISFEKPGWVLPLVLDFLVTDVGDEYES
jgi:hypothetical protein